MGQWFCICKAFFFHNLGWKSFMPTYGTHVNHVYQQFFRCCFKWSLEVEKMYLFGSKKMSNVAMWWTATANAGSNSMINIKIINIAIMFFINKQGFTYFIYFILLNWHWYNLFMRQSQQNGLAQVGYLTIHLNYSIFTQFLYI